MTVTLVALVPETVLLLINPPVTVAEPLLTASDASVVPVESRVPPETVVTLADPPVRLAVPALTVRLPSVAAFVLKVPPVTLERPVTVAGVRLVMLLESIEANVPPEAFRLPALVVAPIVPAEILAVPAAPTVRLVRLAALISVPPVTLADAPEPEVMLVVPAVVVTDPPDTVTLDRSMAVISVPAEATAPV